MSDAVDALVERGGFGEVDDADVHRSALRWDEYESGLSELLQVNQCDVHVLT